MNRYTNCANTRISGNGRRTCGNYQQMPRQEAAVFHDFPVSGGSMFSDPPTDCSRSLLNYIDEVSFGAYESLLFLDTHPDHKEALKYFQDCTFRRRQAMKLYAETFGPLTADDAARTDCGIRNWVMQPWPWEGGEC